VKRGAYRTRFVSVFFGGTGSLIVPAAYASTTARMVSLFDGSIELLLRHVGDAHGLHLLILRQSSGLSRLALGWSRSRGAPTFAPIPTATVELFQQLAHAANRAGLNAICRSPPRVIVVQRFNLLLSMGAQDFYQRRWCPRRRGSQGGVCG
jgi:hypothetical protein